MSTPSPDVRIGGLFTAIADGITEAFRNLQVALFGAPIHIDDNLTPGTTLNVDGTLVMHSLDLIALTHPNDPHGRLDAAFDWITNRVETNALAAVARLEGMYAEKDASLVPVDGA